MEHKPTSRNPAGIVKAKPIALRLMKAELADANRITKKHGISKSALARKAYLTGLPLVVEEMEAA